MKSCSECVFYKSPQQGSACGGCEYPVPEWLLCGVAGGSLIQYDEISGGTCAVFRSRAEVVSEAKDERGDSSLE